MRGLLVVLLFMGYVHASCVHIDCKSSISSSVSSLKEELSSTYSSKLDKSVEKYDKKLFELYEKIKKQNTALANSLRLKKHKLLLLKEVSFLLQKQNLAKQ
jgi:hypothetical protein